MIWPWSRKREPKALVSISDPAAAGYFIPGGLVDFAGVAVGERSALGLSAFYRAGSLISGTLASLPLRSLREDADGTPQKVASIFDDPDGPDGQTVFEWLETLFLHLFVHGRSYAIKVRTQAGALVRLPLVHPLCVVPEEPTLDDYRTGNLPLGGKWFNLTLDNGDLVRWDANDIWEIPGQTTDGFSCFSLVNLARNSLGTAIAGDRAAAVMFGQGALISGLVTPEDDLEPDEVKKLRRELDTSVSGYENAGKLAIVNRRLNFTPWTMTAVDAQFLQSRQFQIEEISRWTGVPPHLLMQTEKQTSWGTGVEEQNRALGRTVLNPYGTRFEQRASRLLARPRWVEFDFAGLERPSPDREIELLIAQVDAKILTVNEARAIRNLPPLPEPEPAPAAPPVAVPEPEPAPAGDDDPEGDDE
ncbi:phage portal protein [Actinoplanes sp. CA-142083]|uniref:phage portal protein n=1 Tax=Actinoplanes sp. CA-142083 TaxID=3239903 RepID=UPI003D910135